MRWKCFLYRLGHVCVYSMLEAWSSFHARGERKERPVEERMSELLVPLLWALCSQFSSSTFVTWPRVDSSSLHHPFQRASVQEFEYSNWYLLILSPTNSSLSNPSPSILAKDLARALGESLAVSPSIFIVSSLIEKQNGEKMVANVSLAKHNLPLLHYKLIALPKVKWISVTKTQDKFK